MSRSEKISLSARFSDESREKYGITFLLALGISAVVMLFFTMMQGGLFTYYGDYNYQQIPFYYHVHEAVRQGRFMWDFSTDLGSDIMQSYTFYLLGSPFFWITVPFPNSALPYLMPWLLCLKTAVAAVAAYAYIRSFSDNTNACCLGGMLYAFSGFQLYNIMFNHFHDAVAFFPLLLLASDKLFMEKKRGFFAVIVAVCAAANYFFFAGMAVFTVIYFIVNVIVKRYRFTVKGFVNYVFEAVLGVLIAAVILLPSAAAVIGNNRAGNMISAADMLAYVKEPSIYLHILKSFFIFPDLSLYMILPVSDDLNCASLSAYLPFVSMCGVIGYFIIRRKKADMFKIMLTICGVCMMIPVLNSMFYMFNGQYYARWFFMPVLIMCAMTSVTVSEDAAVLKKGILPCICAVAVYLIIGLIYGAVPEDGFKTSYFAIQVIVTAGCLALLYSMLCDKSVADNKARVIGILKRTSVCCGLFMVIIIAAGKMTIRSDINYYLNGCLRSRQEIDSCIKSAQEDPEQYFRVDVCEKYQNRNLMWDMSSCSSFTSIVSPSVGDFYEAIGFPRLVNSHTPANYEALRALLSVKYYFDMPLYDDDGMREPFPKLANAVESFDYKENAANMLVYENNCYIPMGFTYDYYTTAEEMEELDNKYFRSQALLEALVLSGEQIERHEDILEHYDISKSKYEYARLKEISTEKTSSACEYFHTDKNGFSAAITLDSDELVFFSVPYDEGWSASVNGEPVQIEKVSYGFMAVRCSSGKSEIRFDYVSKPTLYGAYISLGGLFILVVYIIICGYRVKKMASAAKDA